MLKKISGQKPVLIQIQGTQRFLDGSADSMEFVTTGTYHQREEVQYLLYQESEITGMQGVTTSLKINDGIVVLNRMGIAELKQEFQKGVLYHSHYVTPYGTLRMSVLTHQVESDLTAHGGKISLEYDLFVDDEILSHNGLTIVVKEDSVQ